MREKIYTFGLLVAVVLFVGCSTKIVMVEFNQDADNSARNALSIKADGSTLTTDTKQDSSGELAAAMEAGAAATDALRDVTQEFKPDFSKEDSDNQTTTTNTTNYKDNEDNTIKDEPVKEEISDGVDGVSEDIDYKNKKTYTSYGVRNGGRQAWRIPESGPELGSKIKFVFTSGKTFTVTNTSKNCRDDESTCNRSSSAPMYGFVFKPGLGPNGDGDDNTGTSHGGIYLHAPYGDSSKTVTAYYNKP